MNYFARIGMIASALGLVACASAPVHYYTLLAPLAPTTQPNPTAPFSIDVLPVGIPAQLDQPQLVVRQGDADITVLEAQRWASPLGDEMRGALSAQLSRQLNTQDIAGLVQPANKPVLRIKVQVRRFDAVYGQQVQLEADWSLGLANQTGRSRLSCGGTFSAPAEGGYPELVRAEQRTIMELATKIAQDARSQSAPGAATCSI